MNQAVSAPVMQMIKNEVRRASIEMQSYRPGRAFSDLELAFGYGAFMNWLSTYLNMKEGSQEAYTFASQCNDSARAVALKIMKFVLESDDYRNRLLKSVPGIDPVKELRLQQEPQYNNNYWDNCTTRAAIMICRQMAYNYTGVLGEADFRLAGKGISWDELQGAVDQWIDETC